MGLEYNYGQPCLGSNPQFLLTSMLIICQMQLQSLKIKIESSLKLLLTVSIKKSQTLLSLSLEYVATPLRS